MQTRTKLNAKNSAFKLSEQVKNILHQKGFSFLFNYNDYKYFKKQVNASFDKANAIVNLFLEYHGENNSDFNDYVF